MNLSIVVKEYEKFLDFKTNDQGQGHIYIIFYTDNPISKNLHGENFGHILKAIEEEIERRVGLDHLLSREGAEPDCFLCSILGYFVLNVWTSM